MLFPVRKGRAAGSIRGPSFMTTAVAVLAQWTFYRRTDTDRPAIDGMAKVCPFANLCENKSVHQLFAWSVMQRAQASSKFSGGEYWRRCVSPGPTLWWDSCSKCIMWVGYTFSFRWCKIVSGIVRVIRGLLRWTLIQWWRRCFAFSYKFIFPLRWQGFRVQRSRIRSKRMLHFLRTRLGSKTIFLSHIP